MQVPPRNRPQRPSDTPALEAILKAPRRELDPAELAKLFGQVDEKRVLALTNELTAYIVKNLPAAVAKREGLASYRVNPYVLFTCAKVRGMADPDRLAEFIFNTKLYMGLETSFGKQIEGAFVRQYPLNSDAVTRWISPPEKETEAASLKGLPKEEKTRRRTDSVWREIDRSCVVGDRRFLVSIKSGPNCINDTQVSGMVNAFDRNAVHWLDATRRHHPQVKYLDLAIGITYGTERTTNNKENQFLVKMQDKGFVQEDALRKPGVLIDKSGRVRLYRRIGQDFWAMIGNPVAPQTTRHIFLEVLLALTKSLSQVVETADLETKINLRIMALINAFQRMIFPPKALPDWIRKDFDEQDLFWFTTAIASFYDEGI